MIQVTQITTSSTGLSSDGLIATIFGTSGSSGLPSGLSNGYGVHERLIEWGRYQRSRGAGGQHCGSVEHRWRSPQIWHPPGPRPLDIDHQAAEQVEAAVVTLTTIRRAVLVDHYVYRADPRSTARRAGFPVTDYDVYLKAAAAEVGGLLQSPEPWYSMSGQFDSSRLM